MDDRVRAEKLPHRAGVPEWAQHAVWYQIFPERFRNGDPANDPQLSDVSDRPIPGWSVCPWGKDWYARDPWDWRPQDFYQAVYARRFGGDLPGVREKLDYLQDLGVNAIYLNPVFMAPSLHKYDASCLHHVDPTFGPDRAGDLERLARANETEDPRTWIWTEADRCFVGLVAEIHRRGMRVIIDGVFNHTGTHFFAFQDLLRNGRRSRYRDWYRVSRWHPDGRFDYDGWFGHKALPELARTDECLAEPVCRYVFDITRRWMDPNGDGDPSDGVDGWRLDVAFCVPHGFWKRWRKVVKGINPEAYLTGEIVSLAEEYLRGDEFDAVMNYVWLYPSVRFFSRGKHPITSLEFRQELDVLARAYPQDVGYVLQNLLDSHDVGRIATVLENELPLKSEWQTYFDLSRAMGCPSLVTTRPRDATFQILRQMVVFQMTYPGAPMIYYGTEAGMWGGNDPDNRQPMFWDDIRYEPETHVLRGRCDPNVRIPDRSLFAFYRKAIGLRRSHEALRTGKCRWIETAHDRLLAYERRDARENITVLLNAGDEPLNFNLGGARADLWEGTPAVFGAVCVPPRGWKILA